MAFKIGQGVIWLGTPNTGDSTVQILKTGVVSKVNSRGDTIWVDGFHRAEDALYAAFAFPNTEEACTLLRDTLAMTARHNAENQANYVRTLQFANQCVKDGIK